MMNDRQSRLLKRIQLCNWTVLLVLVAGGWLTSGTELAGSVFLGGGLANISFWFLKNDLTRLLKGDPAVVKTRFFIKYYARLAGLAVLLLMIVKVGKVNLTGLLVGLSTVFVSIALTTASQGRKVFKEAA